MSKVLVTYRVKPEAAAENEALIAQVYQEIHRTNPTDLHFATVVADDGLRFVHVASSEGDGQSPLTALPAFQAFRAGLVKRCSEPMSRTERREIGGAVGIATVSTVLITRAADDGLSVSAFRAAFVLIVALAALGGAIAEPAFPHPSGRSGHAGEVDAAPEPKLAG